MISDQGQLDELCARVASVPVVGVDTEYLTDRRYYPELCLIQVGTDDERALVDPLAGLDLSPLGRVLDGRGPAVVMHNAPADAPLLVRATGCLLGPVFDTMFAAGFLGSGELSLGSVVQRYVGVALAKDATLTDWSRRPLPDGALRYAEEDVAYLPELWRVLSSQLATQGREQWVADEVGRAIDKAMDPPDPAQAWRRLESARRLRGLSLAVGAEVAAWRMRTAISLNRPVKRVMGDLGVLAVAEAKPSTLDELEKTRGIDRGVLRDHGKDILAAVAKAKAGDPSEWPKRASGPPPEMSSVHDALGLAARMVAHDAGIASWLAYERDDLAGLAEDPPRGRLASGWRAEVLGPPLLDLLHGRRALTITGRRLHLVECANKDPD